MANNPYVNKVVYGGQVVIDITDTTAVAGDVAQGKYFYDASGAKVEGTNTGSGMIVVETQDEHGGTIVSITGDPVVLQTKSATPTEQSQVIRPDDGYTGLSQVNVGAISSTYVGSDIPERDSTDLSVSGATVSVPSGYYEDDSSKTIPNGSASTPATSITADPTISVNSSTGLITATASASKGITPTVSAGYISSGTSGTVTVSGSNTQQLTTKAATTITPTKSSQQAVASGVYTTGAITVAAIPAAYQDVTGVTAAAGDVVSGKDIVNSSGTVVHGSLIIQHYYTGSGTPSSSQGVDGDIYLKTS